MEQKLEEARKDSPQSLQERVASAFNPPPPGRECTFVISSHPVGGHLHGTPTKLIQGLRRLSNQRPRCKRKAMKVLPSRGGS